MLQEMILANDFCYTISGYPCHWGESRIYFLKLDFSILFRKNNSDQVYLQTFIIF